MTNSLRADDTSVYRYYDANGILIYAGVTARGIRRNLEHSLRAEWWPLVERQEVEHLPTRDAALAREAELIQRHRPPFNVQQNPDHQAIRRAYKSQSARITNETPDDVFRRVGKSIPVSLVGAVDGEVTFATRPEEWRLASVLELPPRAPLITDVSIVCGAIRGVEVAGFSVLLHCVARKSADFYGSGVLQIKCITRKGANSYEIKNVIADGRQSGAK